MPADGAFGSLVAAITIMGSGRVGPTLTALVGLVGVVVGVQALARARRGVSSGRDRGIDPRRRARAALVLGAVGLGLGVLFLATADGGPGTGNGVVGSGAAIVLGTVALVLGGLAWVPAGRTDPAAGVAPAATTPGDGREST